MITQKARWLQGRLQTVLLELGTHRMDCLVERGTLANPGFLNTGGSPVAGNRPCGVDTEDGDAGMWLGCEPISALNANT